MDTNVATELRAALFGVAATYWKIVDGAGAAVAHAPLGAAIVSVLNRVDEVLLALPTPEDLRLALVDRHPWLDDTREREADATQPVRLERDAARDVCAAIVAHDVTLSAVQTRIRETCPPDEQTYLVELIGRIARQEYADILAPLWALHPDLTSHGVR